VGGELGGGHDRLAEREAHHAEARAAGERERGPEPVEHEAADEKLRPPEHDEGGDRAPVDGQPRPGEGYLTTPHAIRSPPPPSGLGVSL
jgi:hypothetical protein